MRTYSRLILAVVVLISTISSIPVDAGIPEVIHPQTGAVIGWQDPAAIPYLLDQGTLGRLTHEQAVQLVQEMMYVWSSLPTANVGFVNEGELKADVNETNIFDYMNAVKCKDDSTLVPFPYNPIIFDTDGKALEDFVGSGSSGEIGGLSALTCFGGSVANPTRIIQGLVLLNGAFVDGKGDESSPDDLAINVFSGVILHELGHFLGIGHSELNYEFFQEIDASEKSVTYSKYLPVMLPTVLRNSVSSTVPKPDEISVLSQLYPKGGFADQVGSISGNIIIGSGEFKKANVVARRTDDPLCEAYATVSGRFCTPLTKLGMLNFNGSDCDEAAKQGDYLLSGIPGGDYTIDVGEIPGGWIQEGIFPYGYQAILPGDAEFYNKDDQASEDPFKKDAVTLAAKGSLFGIDISLSNGPAGSARMLEIPLNNFTEASTSRCHIDVVNYATAIGVKEIVDLGDEANQILNNLSGESPLTGGNPEADLAGDGSGSSGGGCSIGGLTEPTGMLMLALMLVIFIAGANMKRIRKNIITLLVVLITVGYSGSSFATSWVQVGMNQMVQKSGRIFAGKCIGVQAKIDERGLAVTEVTYQVQSNVKGDTGTTQVFRTFGVNDNGVSGMVGGKIVGMPDFYVGREDVLFLYPESKLGLTAPVGISGGIVPIIRDAGGKAYIENPFARDSEYVNTSKSLKIATTPLDDDPLMRLDLFLKVVSKAVNQ